jgi:hypothetical protein
LAFFGFRLHCVDASAQSSRRAPSTPDRLPRITAQQSFARRLADSSGYTANTLPDHRRTAPGDLATGSPPDTDTRRLPQTTDYLSPSRPPSPLAPVIRLGSVPMDPLVIRSVSSFLLPFFYPLKFFILTLPRFLLPPYLMMRPNLNYRINRGFV